MIGHAKLHRGRNAQGFCSPNCLLNCRLELIAGRLRHA